MKLTDIIAEKIRGNDSFNVYKRISDEDLIMKVLTRKKRSLNDLYENISDDNVFAVKIFYESIAVMAERMLGVQVNCCFDISMEGFGKVLLYHEYYILFIKHLRNLHQFGFNSMESINRQGMEILEKCICNHNNFMPRKQPSQVNYTGILPEMK